MKPSAHNAAAPIRCTFHSTPRGAEEDAATVSAVRPTNSRSGSIAATSSRRASATSTCRFPFTASALTIQNDLKGTPSSRNAERTPRLGGRRAPERRNRQLTLRDPARGSGRGARGRRLARARRRGTSPASRPRCRRRRAASIFSAIPAGAVAPPERTTAAVEAGDEHDAQHPVSVAIRREPGEAAGNGRPVSVRSRNTTWRGEAMPRYRGGLPQLERTFVTDGGLETTLIFHDGLDLPLFAAFDLLKDDEGTAALYRYFQPYARDRARPRRRPDPGEPDLAGESRLGTPDRLHRRRARCDEPQGDRPHGTPPGGCRARGRVGSGRDQRLRRPPGRRVPARGAC